MSKKIRLFSVGLIVFVVVLMAFASTALASYNMGTHTADHSAVIKSVHDVTRNDPAANPCDNCHIPHGAKGSFLFSKAPKAITPSAGSTSDIEPLCYSCHDGSIATTGLTTVFSTTQVNHKTTAASTLNSAGTAATGSGKDCDRCHDPHDDGNTHFLKYERSRTSGGVTTWTPITAGGNVCASCHAGNVDPSSGGASTNGMNHKTNVVPSAASIPTDAIWNGVTDLSGTRLFDPSTHLVSSLATAQVNCETCHTPHGGVNDTLNTMSTNNSALCLNCHK